MDTFVQEFRVIPCVAFRCLECSNWLKVEKNLPDLTSTSVTCQQCRSEYCVMWGISDQEVRIKMMLEGA